MATTYDLILVCFALILPFSTIAAAYQDVRYLRIPNPISIALAVLYLPVALFSPLAITEIALSYAVGLVVLVAGAVLFWRGIIGGGDAKLLAAVAIWVGWPGIGPFLFGVAIFGGVFALLFVSLRFVPSVITRKFLPWLGDVEILRQKMPYGLAIMASSLLYFPKIPMLVTVFPKIMQ